MFLFRHTKYLLRLICLFILLGYSSLRGFDMPRKVKWPKGYENAVIIQLERDAKDNIWVLTHKGLLVMDGYNLLPVKLTDFPIQSCRDAYPHMLPHKIKAVQNELYLFYKTCGLTVLKWPYLRQETVFDQGVVDMLGLEQQEQLVLFESGKLVKYSPSETVELRDFGELTDAELMQIDGNKVLLNIKNQAIHQFLLGFKGLENVFSLPASKPLLGVFLKNRGNRLVFRNESYILDEILLLDSKQTYEKQLLFWAFFPQFNFEVLQNNPIRLQLIVKKDTLEVPVPGRVTHVQFLNQNLFYVACGNDFLVFEKNAKVSQEFNDDYLFEESFQRVRRKIVVLGSQQILFLGYPKLVKASISNKGEISRFSIQETNKGSSLSGELYSIYNGVTLGDKLYCVSEGKGFISFDLHAYRVDKYVNNHLDSKGYYYAIAIKDSQTLLIGANQNLVSYNIKTNQSTSFRIKELGTYGNIYDILRLQNGEILVASSEGLFLYDQNLQRQLWFYEDFKNDLDNLFRSIIEHKTADFHYIWAASQKGVIVFDRHTKQKVKVFDKGSLHIHFRPATFIVDKNQNMWISSYQGVLGINPKTWKTLWLKNKSNLINQEFNYQSGALLPNGNLIFGGITTYESIDPKLLFNATLTPQISLTAYIVEDEDGEKVHLIDETIMPKNVYVKLPSHKLELYFSDKKHQATFPYTFKYKIGNGPWVLASNTSSLIFSNLPYGKHLVEIRFLDDLNQQMSQSFKFNLHIQERFYKTTYFLSLMYFGIALLLSGVYVVVKNNINIKRRTLKLVFLDLKGEISAYIEEAQVLTDKALQGKNKMIQLSLLPSVALDIKEARTFLNLYIESLTKDKISVEDLKSNLYAFLHKQFKKSSTVFNLDFEVENNQDLDTNLVKDIKLSVYEICNNVLKHANATSVHIKLIFIKKAIKLIAIDNGTLKNVNTLFNKGNGILNLQKRAQRNNGTAIFDINKTLGNGLQISMIFTKK